MFAVHCPRHGTRVLLTERRIRALHNTGTGIVIEAECYDGERVFVVTGRGAPADLAVSHQLAMLLVANRGQAASPKTVA
ncbi:MAG: hypothetical protein ACRDRR_07440 [Pseudonocardiaceae bacterium]